MLNALKHKFANTTISLQSSLLAIFIGLFIITTFIFISIFYFYQIDLITRAASLIIDRESYSVMNELNTRLFPIQGATVFSAEMIDEKIIDTKNVNEMQGYILQLLNKFPLVNAVYWGDEQGNFIGAQRENQLLMVVSVDRATIIPKQVTIFYDKNKKVVSQEETQPKFDPRTRPWFQAVQRKKTMLWTNVYLYDQVSDSKLMAPSALGISIVAPILSQDKKVLSAFAMDVRLDYLSNFIEMKKTRLQEATFIIDQNGNLIAAPKLPKAETKNYEKNGLIYSGELPRLYQKAFQKFNQQNDTTFFFQENNKNYIASFKKIPFLTQHGWYLGMIDILHDYTQPLVQAEFTYLLLDTIIFILGILMIIKLIQRVIKPIKKLVKETEKIRSFKLEPSTEISSHIKEVQDLSNAIYSMKLGLRSFQKYVPATLVRKLIRLGEDVRIGGKKTQLIILFSDIQHFTAITEHRESQQTMQQLCDYFEVLSRVIADYKGTLDKYIGDGIMAFWGAPKPVLHSHHYAALTALRCLKQSNELNKEWLRKNQPEFKTQIGLHCGETIVGNIGSSERLNYTAVGDTVNITSRLVGANKLYGTSILVTDAIYPNLKNDFILRRIDKVTFKGKADAITLYELISEKNEPLGFDIEMYTRYFDQGYSAYLKKDWQKAITYFESCLEIYPNDKVAPVFINRCHDFLVKPPGSDWDGVWHMMEKY